MLHSDFFITQERHDSALEAIQRLDPQKIYPDSSEPHFAFIQGLSYQQAKTLDEALQTWRWLPDLDDEGNIVAVEFLGEKLGDDEVLFEAIAPFVGDGSHIQMAGEDGRIWRWLFRSGTVQKQEGEIVFRPTPETKPQTKA